MKLTPSTRNVLRVFRAASPETVAAGLDWYPRASRLSAELDPSDPRRAAAVIAVLSPLTPWARNLQLARDAYAAAANGGTYDEITDAIGTLGKNAEKAAAILTGADPDLVVAGPKVSPFWRKITDPDDARAIVIDRHAFDVAVGRWNGDKVRGPILARKGMHAAFADAYIRAARIASRETGRRITATDMQAITWLAWRESAKAHHQGRAAARADKGA